MLLAQVVGCVAALALGLGAAMAFGLVWASLITSLDRSMGSGFIRTVGKPDTEEG
jgi:hypothetical protein